VCGLDNFEVKKGLAEDRTEWEGAKFSKYSFYKECTL
jgi:hypothetical protein